MKQYIIYLLLLTFSLFAQGNNNNILLINDNDTTDKEKKNYFAFDVSVGINYTSVNFGSLESNNINLPFIKTRLVYVLNNFDFGFGCSRQTVTFDSKVEKREEISQLFIGLNYYPINKKKYLVGVYSEFGKNFSKITENWGIWGRIGFTGIYKIKNQLYLITNFGYEETLIKIGKSGQFFTLNIGTKYNFNIADKSKYNEIANSNKTNIGFSYGLLLNVLQSKDYYCAINYIPSYPAPYDSSDAYYKNSFIFISRSYPVVELNIKTKKLNFHSLGYNYRNIYREIYDDCCGISYNKLNLKDLNVYYQFDFPLNKNRYLKNPNSSALIYLGLITNFNYKNLYKLDYFFFDYYDNNSETENNSFMVLTQLSPSIKKLYSHLYYGFGINLNLFGYTHGKYKYKYTKTNIQFEEEPEIKSEINEKYDKVLFINDIYNDKLIFNSIYLKIGYLF